MLRTGNPVLLYFDWCGLNSWIYLTICQDSQGLTLTFKNTQFTSPHTQEHSPLYYQPKLSGYVKKLLVSFQHQRSNGRRQDSGYVVVKGLEFSPLNLYAGFLCDTPNNLELLYVHSKSDYILHITITPYDNYVIK